MAMNFCNPAFGTSVSCSSVSADGYEPENLLKPGAFGLWKGFLAEHFIKPPLNITFTFPFEIDICCIIIDPNVGSQHSSGVEIFSATLPKAASSAGSATGISSRDVSRDSAEPSIVSTNIGKGYCNNASPRLILFTNRMYRTRHKDLPPAPLHIRDAPDVLTRDFRCPSPLCVRSVNKVVIRITRVQGGSVPALKRVEIWGQPAPSCERNVVQRILEMARCVQGLGKRQAKGQARGQKSSAGSHHRKSAENSGGNPTEETPPGGTGSGHPAECPEEFLDPITCSMMVIPILLPSGHTVDKETLEKHHRIEANWGRPPNDPFTGVPFSQVNKPIPNVKLKVRIDKFLLSGGTAFQNVPRTVGRSKGQETEIPTDASLRTSVLLQPGEMGIQKGAISDFQATNNAKSLGVSPGEKKDQLAQKVPSKKRQFLELCEISQDEHPGRASKKSRTCDSRDTPSTQSTPHVNGEVGHEKLVSDSLDDALASTLASLPSYSKPVRTKPEIPTDDKAIDLCTNCSASVKDAGANVYSMPCGHYICRKCTVQMTSGILCHHCKKEFKTAEISRVHTR